MSARSRLSVAVVSTLLVGYVFVGSVLGRVLGDSSYAQLAVFNEVVRFVLDAYVEPVDLDRAMAGARLGLTDALDGDSAYLGAAELRRYQQGAAGKGRRRSGWLSPAALVPGGGGSPARGRLASESGDQGPGDIVKTIDGRHTRPLSPP